MRSIHLEMIRVTEAAAIAASHWVGRGDKLAADRDATEAMKKRLNKLNFVAQVVIGEGKKDGSYGLFEGDWVGIHRDKRILTAPSQASSLEFFKKPPCYEIAVDPIDGTRPTIEGGNEAISVMAVGSEGSLFRTDEYYMKKLAVGNALRGHGICIEDPLEVTINIVARVLGKDISNVTVCLLDRPRHDDIMEELKSIGCRIKLIRDCDVTAAVSTSMAGTGVDVLVGIGGSPEGVISACAMKCLNGIFQAQLVNKETWTPYGKVMHEDDLAKGDVIFCATGITDGSLLKGVSYENNRPRTNSIFMRSESNTIRKIEGIHGN